VKVLQSIKDGARQRKKKLKNVSMALNMNYSLFSRYINGFDRPPKEFEKRVQEIFVQWDKECLNSAVSQCHPNDDNGKDNL
jgi:hypothetical protein